LKRLSEDKEDFEGKLGFDKKTAAEMLHRFIATKEETRKHIYDLRAMQTGNVDSPEILELERAMETVNQQIADVRDWYGLHVLEGLEKESRRLKWLTIVLIALTAVLTVFTTLLVSGIRLP